MHGTRLLERVAALDVLAAAVADADRGSGCVVVVSGEAGIGKTSLLRAFRAQSAGRARVWAGACDDLVTARAVGPLRDAVSDTGGPLDDALSAGDGDAVFDAVIAQLDSAPPTPPGVLVVEDLHWADDATLDVLGFLARRIARLRAVLVVTVRNGGAPDGHPLHRWLGGLAGCPVRRLVLRPLSAGAVAELAAGSGWDPAVLLDLTAGNPFFVTEALASGPTVDEHVPATVADAVMARLRRLSPACQTALEQLSVIPGTVEFELAEALLAGGLDALAEGEERGMLEVRPGGLAFRHELARRAVEAGVSKLRRRALHRAVVSVLERQRHPDLARLVHHAAKAHDVDAVLRYGAEAGREAAAAGSHRQALAHFEAVVRHRDRLDAPASAALLDEYAWELHNAHRFADALRAGETAVALYAQLADPIALGTAQVRLSRYRYLAGDTDAAQEVARASVAVLEPAGSIADRAYAATYLGAVLALGGDPAAAATLDRALHLARQADRPDLGALTLNYLSIARRDLPADERITLLRESLRLALRNGQFEPAARAYANLAELLYRYHRFTELTDCVRDGLEFTTGRGFWSHAYNLEVHRHLLHLRRGDWTAAADGLAALLDRDGGMLGVYAEPAHGRLLARRGDPEAAHALTAAWERGRRQRSVLGLAYTGSALMEWAWLARRPDRAADVLAVWRPHAERPTAEPAWAELLRYAARVGLGVPEPGPDCPEPWASGLRGDWRAAAEQWRELGDPYEEALELADSREPEPTVVALRILDDLGAAPAARIVRRRARELGVRTVPRGPHARTRAHPAGLTARQADVLTLLAEDLTNAEIADQLVLSVRTVDHHVSAILTKLGVPSRRQAIRVARTLESA